MAVDANVLIFERIREELRDGKSPARAVELGFDRAFSAIMDSNVTGLITAIIMFAIGSGAVRGFAVTTGLGIFTSMFTAVYVTRLIVTTYINWKQPKELVWVTFGASIVAVVVSILAVAIMGLNFGVDFKGGTTIRTESTQAVDVGVYREAMTGLGLGDVAITQVFDPTFREDQHVAMVRIEAQEGEE
eukprot:gene12149-14852_t